jgi:hypothetical protein
MRLRVRNECGGQQLPALSGEAKPGKEHSFTTSFRMIEGEEVILDFALIDPGSLSIRKSHSLGDNESARRRLERFSGKAH